MGVHSGRFGMINGFSAVRSWSANDISSPKKFIHSATKGGPGRKKGIRDWNGTASMYGAKPLVMPGSFFSFAGFTAPNSDVYGSNGVTYSGPAIVDQVVVTWNFESGDILAHTMNFSGNGPLVRGTGHYEDESEPELEVPQDLTVEADGEDVCNITTVTLTLTAENKPYVNSCTEGWTKRKTGNIDATLAIALHDTDPEEFAAEIASDLEFKLYTNDTEFWWLKWMHFKDTSGINVNIESGDVIGFTANFEFNGQVTPGEGKIVLPGESDAWWPVPVDD